MSQLLVPSTSSHLAPTVSSPFAASMFHTGTPSAYGQYAAVATSSSSPQIDLDLRVTEHPATQAEQPYRSDYLTCKTDSTCDGSDAC